MSVSDIKIQLQELYNTEISESLISRVTDEVIDWPILIFSLLAFLMGYIFRGNNEN